MDVDTNAFLKPLIGEYLSGVYFVMDYVQLDFSGQTLTVYNPLTVTADRALWSRADSGWREALCARIGRHVVTGTCSDNEINIEFEDGAAFSVSLRDEAYIGPEAFNFASPGAST
ncbi:MAG TPA: hypothetical protein VG271_04700, partial [Beijerinckiaceae bacterium]|nr:hypothetical protein [Beijerinckiaceae bacterium]